MPTIHEMNFKYYKDLCVLKKDKKEEKSLTKI